jgi:ubiquitin-protein ligase
MSTPRLRRLQADYEQVVKAFTGHPYITVRASGGKPPTVYHVTYRVPGLRLGKRGTPEEIDRHEVVFQLTAKYPQMKPKCSIQTPLFHPNFRNGIVCIGDHWAAGGETLVDLIVKVGDMIQFKEYNIKSPMDAEAARWARANEGRFPIGNLELYPQETQVRAFSQREDDWEIEFKPADGEVNDFELIFH